jgi:hypothetical protein
LTWIYVAPIFSFINWLDKSNPDWGSVPDWLAGIGAMLALLFAGWAARSAHKTNVLQGIQLRKLEEREEERQQEEQRVHAASVAVWLDTKFVAGHEQLQFFYSNSGALPVYNVRARVEFFREVMDGRWYEIHLLPPTTKAELNDKTTSAVQKDFYTWFNKKVPSETLENHGRTAAGSNTAEYSAKLVQYLHRARRMGVELEFEDCEGRVWTRDRHGRLSKQRK